MLKKVDKYSEYFGIKLGSRCIMNNLEDFELSNFSTRIVGIDLTAFQSGLEYIMIEKYNGFKISETKFDNSEIVYYKDTRFIWCSLKDITFPSEE